MTEREFLENMKNLLQIDTKEQILLLINNRLEELKMRDDDEYMLITLAESV